MPSIHPTAVVSPKADIADDASVGPFAVVHDDVRIGEGSVVGAHCLVDDGARIGRNCVIHHGTAVSTPPQDLKYAGEPTECIVGDHTTVREYCTLNRGTRQSLRSVVGTHCLLMAFTHVAHDCRLGDHVIIANAAQMGGHTIIGDHAIIGGLVGIHQFTHIGAHAMLAAGIRVVKDVPPYALAGRSPAVFEGINAVGLRRRGFSDETRTLIERAYRALYYEGRNVSQGVAWIRANLPQTPEIEEILTFIASSERGIMKPAR